MPGYYDLVLGLIPVALLGISGLLSATGFTTTMAANVGGLVAVALVGHALFVRAPADSVAPGAGARTDARGPDAPLGDA